MNLQKITITKSSLYFRECKACGCVTLHVGRVTPQMTPGSTYNDCLQCLVDTHSVPGLSRWHDPKTGKRFVDEHTLTTSISRIRSKIETDGGAPYIKTIYGMGYQWMGGEAK